MRQPTNSVRRTISQQDVREKDAHRTTPTVCGSFFFDAWALIKPIKVPAGSGNNPGQQKSHKVLCGRFASKNGQELRKSVFPLLRSQGALQIPAERQFSRDTKRFTAKRCVRSFSHLPSDAAPFSEVRILEWRRQRCRRRYLVLIYTAFRKRNVFFFFK